MGPADTTLSKHPTGSAAEKWRPRPGGDADRPHRPPHVGATTVYPWPVPIDEHAQAYLHLLAASVPPITELTAEEYRSATAELIPQQVGEVEPVASFEDAHAEAGGLRVRVRIYRPERAPVPAPALIFFHGGGWVVGSIETHDGVCRALANRARCIVVSVDYRLAPEHRFPAAVDDSWAATVWVADEVSRLGIDPGRLAVGGDSAGGNLAAVVSLLARDHDLDLCLQLLVYPVCDHSFGTRSYDENAEGFGLTRDAMRWYWEQYLGPAGDGSSPHASPLRALALANVARAHVVTVEFDPLRDEGEAYAERLAESGVPVTRRRFDGLIHGVFRLTAAVPRSYELIDDAAEALRAEFDR